MVINVLQTGGKEMKHVLVALLLVGCSDPPPNRIAMEGDLTQVGRFHVKQVATFRDEYAYNNRRGIYTIVDTQTGHEYVGISGIGIAELDSETHCYSSGKSTSCTTIEVER